MQIVGLKLLTEEQLLELRNMALSPPFKLLLKEITQTIVESLMADAYNSVLGVNNGQQNSLKLWGSKRELVLDMCALPDTIAAIIKGRQPKEKEESSV